MHRRKTGSNSAQIVSALAWMLVVAGVLGAVVGCDGFPTATVISPGEVEAKAVFDPETGLWTKTITAKSPGYKGDAAGAGNFKSQTPGIVMPAGGGLEVKGTDTDASFKGQISNGHNWLYGIGAVAVIGGLISIKLLGLGPGLAIAGAGVVWLVLVHFLLTYPLLAFGMVAIILGGGGYWYWRTHQDQTEHKSVANTLRDLIRSIEKTGGDAAATIKAMMRTERRDKDTVKAVVDKVKAESGID